MQALLPRWTIVEAEQDDAARALQDGEIERGISRGADAGDAAWLERQRRRRFAQVDCAGDRLNGPVPGLTDSKIELASRGEGGEALAISANIGMID